MASLTQSNNGYPSSSIDPREKNFDWILQYVRAAWHESQGLMPAMFYLGQSKFREIRQYALGKQSITKYKKFLNVDEVEDKSWQSINWEVPSFITKYREIAISKLLQREFDVQAYAIDPLAKSEEDKYFNEQKIRIQMYEAAKKANSPLADSPILKPSVGEPQDEEQLNIEMEFGYKHVMSMEAEEAIQLVQQQNQIDELRKRVCENLFDYGIGGYTTFIDENGMCKFREVCPENLILSRCSKNDFSDLVHWGEVIEVRVADLVPFFTKEQLDDICTNVAGKFGNPANLNISTALYNQGWNRFKVLVCDFKFLNWNETVYKNEVDGRGNKRFVKSDYKNKQFIKGNIVEEYNQPLADTMGDMEQGESTPKYMTITKEVVYKTKWLIGTGYMYDYGLSENMSRKKSSWWKTSLDIQLYAWNFYDMMYTGITERLMPLEDDACLTWFKLQNLSAKLIPYLINIDFNSVESVAFGAGGGKMKPKEVMDFIFSNFVVPYRSTDLLSKNPNYKPVTIEATGQLEAFGQLYEKLNNTIELMRQISGLNELTDGSTPNAKTLVPVADAAMQSTNNALYLLSNAEKRLMLMLSDSIIQKVQIAVKLGKVEGYAKALGAQSVKFLQINPDIALYELGIFVEDAPTKEERAALWQEVSVKESQGLLSVADKIMVMSCRNLKQAALLLDYKIKKNKEQAQQNQLQLAQQQAQGNAQASIAIEQAKQQTIQMQGQIDLAKIDAQGRWVYMTEAMKKQSDQTEAHIQSDAKIISNQIMADAKKEASLQKTA